MSSVFLLVMLGLSMKLKVFMWLDVMMRMCVFVGFFEVYRLWILLE